MNAHPLATSAGEEKTRKPRRITSENIDETKPAAIIIAKAGGLTNFCRDYDFATSTVHSWMLNGLIPTRKRIVPALGEVSYHAWILHRSAELGHGITAGDFIEKPVEA